jgi:hypothetical protein
MPRDVVQAFTNAVCVTKVFLSQEILMNVCVSYVSVYFLGCSHHGMNLCTFISLSERAAYVLRHMSSIQHCT